MMLSNVPGILGQQELFPEGHPLASLVKPTFSSVRQALSTVDISFIWHTTKFDEDRRSQRVCYSELHGPGSELCMPLAAAYLVSPGENAMFVPDDYINPITGKHYPGLDVTALEYLAEQGFIGRQAGQDYIRVADFAAMRAVLTASNRRVYTVDDLGEAFDAVTANSQAAMHAINSKEFVREFTAFAPTEIRTSLDLANLSDYHRCAVAGRRVFLKTCNTEAAGEGVFPVSSEAEYLAKVIELREFADRFASSRALIIQPEIVGVNKSFQVLIDPNTPDKIQVIALTDQLIAADGKSYAGSINHPVTAETLSKIGTAIVDMVNRIGQKFPQTFGFLMCDYFECPDGKVVLFDPGLRPTGNTPAAMVRLWFEEKTGRSATTTSFFIVEHGRGILYREVAERLGELADAQKILQTGYGVLPWGHNHVSGRSIFTLVTPTPTCVDEFKSQVRERLGVA